MSEPAFYLNCWWGSRSESAQTFAERLADTLRELARLHRAFGRWNQQAETRADANRPLCSMPPSIEELTRIAENNLCTPGAPVDGYFLSAWNGRDGPYGLSFILHAGSTRPFLSSPNSFEISFPHRVPANADLINARLMKSALLAAVLAWNPDWAGIGPWSYSRRWLRAEPWDDEQRKATKEGPWLPAIRSGWMTYLCADYARRIRWPSGIDVEPVITGGSVLIATEETFAPGNPEHDAAADAIQDALLPLQNLPCEAMRR